MHKSNFSPFSWPVSLKTGNTAAHICNVNLLFVGSLKGSGYGAEICKWKGKKKNLWLGDRREGKTVNTNMKPGGWGGHRGDKLFPLWASTLGVKPVSCYAV